MPLLSICRGDKLLTALSYAEPASLLLGQLAPLMLGMVAPMAAFRAQPPFLFLTFLTFLLPLFS